MKTIKRLALSILITSALISAYPHVREAVICGTYEGDGRIEDISTGIFNGYRVYFDSFGLKEEFSGSFTIRELPPVDREMFFEVQVFEETGALEYGFRGELSMSLLDAKGGLIWALQGPSEQWRKVSGPRGLEAILLGDAQGQLSSIEYEKAMERLPLQFEISYKPLPPLERDRALVERKFPRASVLMTTGGGK